MKYPDQSVGFFHGKASETITIGEQM